MVTINFALLKESEKKDKTIHQIFEEQVEKTPENIAVIFENQKLTYRELNAKANQLASYLRAQVVGANLMVGICLDRCKEMLITILGILKAGYAYVPIEPAYPTERIQYILADTKMPIIITQSKYSSMFVGIKAVYLDLSWPQILDFYITNLDINVNPQDLAYVIYTSGSTGKPKGVMIEHTGVVNTILSQTEVFEVNARSHVISFASVVFDVSVADFLLALFNGATLCIAPRDENYLEGLIKLLKTYDCCIVTLPVTIAKELPVKEIAKNISTVVVAGEACDSSIIEQWADKCRLINAYGPTECSIYVSAALLISGSIPHIGKPIFNIKMYVLDANLNPVPIGVTGELYVGGVGLARGYLNLQELTDECFIKNPFGEGKLYKTGDLVRYLPDGNIEYVGRVDFQVKLRGLRIELGEIEAVLQSNADVLQAVVIVREDEPSNQYLAAYVVPKAMLHESEYNDSENNEIFIEKLKKYLAAKLPNYMVPNSFALIRKLPLNINGKVDRKALPKPAFNTSSKGFIAPRNYQEEELVNIWNKILGFQNIGIVDNLFSLGGNSLSIIKIAREIKVKFQVELPIKALFEAPTIESMVELIKERSSKNSKLQASLKMMPKTKHIPLSFAQQRLWFLEKLIPNSSMYNILMALQLEGNLNIEALQKSFECIINCNEALRTTFKEHQGNIYQNISNNCDFSLGYKDLSDLDKRTKEKALNALIKEETLAPFNLNQGPLLKASIIEIDHNKYVLLFNMHHIISDGWSLHILFQELSKYYNDFVQNKEPAIVKSLYQYSDFSIWQREYLKEDLLAKQIKYWQQELQNIPEVIELPLDRARTTNRTYQGSIYSYQIPKKILMRLKSLSQSQNVTMFMMMLSIFQVLLYRYSNQETVVVGTPIANRHIYGTEELIGFFVNTLAIRMDIVNGLKFTEVLMQIKQRMLNAQENQDLPFDQIVEHLNIERCLDRQPLFQVMFVMDEWQLVEQFKLDNLKIGLYAQTEITAKFDLTLNAKEYDQHLELSFEYATDIFNKDTIRKMAKHFEVLANGIVNNPSEEIAKLSILTQQEITQQLIEWNKTEIEYLKHKTIHEFFEEQVKKTPDKVAVVFEEEKLTYKELNEKSNQLARYLREQVVGSNLMVGICLDRGKEMLVAILGVLKAGYAYVPIEPVYPKERIEYILTDTRMPAIITQLKYILIFNGIKKLYLDLHCSQISDFDITNLDINVNSQDLAYVIYTSGSTGKPKGVMIEHTGVVNTILSQTKIFEVNERSHVIGFASVVFDASVADFLLALFNGATLCIAPRDENYLEELIKLLKTYDCCIITLPVTIAKELPVKEIAKNISTVIVAGEACDSSIIEQWADSRLINGYGPTECSIYVSSALLSAGSIPHIGKPISNMKSYVLDANLNPVPIGVTGELYVGGVGLARGYLNLPELTHECFIKNPFGEGKLYKTGDLVRYLPDGNIEYVGRADFQVKLRGLRIELGEIEAVLQSNPDVLQAVVTVREDKPSNKYLAAYVIPKAMLQKQYIVTGNNIDQQKFIEGLKKYLIARLPNYMVPNSFTLMEKMPLNVNGKVDRKALPKPNLNMVSKGYIPPRDNQEQMLVNIWSEILGIKKVSITDNFFNLGGNSLLAVKLVSRMNKILLNKISVRFFFEHSTIEDISDDQHLNNYHFKQKTFVNLSQEAILDPTIQVTKDIKQKFTNEIKHIFITGATGFVGKYLVSELLETTNAMIYCLVRKGRCVITALQEQGLRQEERYSNRIIHIVGDIEKPYLGLSEEQFNKLASIIDLVYHNAVLMNHFASYDFLKQANVKGTEEILRFATTAKLKAVQYISTISVFSEDAYFTEPREVKESTPIDHEKHFHSSGYSSSKWVAEKLTHMAIERGIPCNIYRLGLILWDYKSGKYDTNQWFYKFIKSCLMLGAYPASLHKLLPIISVNEATKSIVRLSYKSHNNIYHIFDPKLYSFEQKLHNIFRYTNVKPKCASEWLSLLKNSKSELPVTPILEADQLLAEEKFIANFNINFNYFNSETTCRQLYQHSIVSLKGIRKFLTELYKDGCNYITGVNVS